MTFYCRQFLIQIAGETVKNLNLNVSPISHNVFMHAAASGVP